MSEDYDSEFSDLSEDEKLIIFGTLWEETEKEIANYTDELESQGGVNFRKSKLVERGYLEKAGRGDYRPGEKLEDYEGISPKREDDFSESRLNEITGFEEVNAARPSKVNGDE